MYFWSFPCRLWTINTAEREGNPIVRRPGSTYDQVDGALHGVVPTIGDRQVHRAGRVQGDAEHGAALVANNDLDSYACPTGRSEMMFLKPDGRIPDAHAYRLGAGIPANRNG